MPTSAHSACCLSLCAVLVACGGETTPDVPAVPTIEVACTPSQQQPYADGIPYLGIHADAGNSDVVRCKTGSAFTPVWHSLTGLGAMQPNTFSRDGKTTYVTTTNPDPDGCRLHAIDTASGAVQWCANYPGSIARSAVEVDSDGHLYLTVAGVTRCPGQRALEDPVCHQHRLRRSLGLAFYR